MTMQKITLEDFAKNVTLKTHTQRSKAVARALDTKAQTLPYAKTFTSFEFEGFLSQLTPKRFELLRLASKGGRSISDLATVSTTPWMESTSYCCVRVEISVRKPLTLPVL